MLFVMGSRAVPVSARPGLRIIDGIDVSWALARSFGMISDKSALARRCGICALSGYRSLLRAVRRRPAGQVRHQPACPVPLKILETPHNAVTSHRVEIKHAVDVRNFHAMHGDRENQQPYAGMV